MKTSWFFMVDFYGVTIQWSILSSHLIWPGIIMCTVDYPFSWHSSFRELPEHPIHSTSHQPFPLLLFTLCFWNILSLEALTFDVFCLSLLFTLIFLVILCSPRNFSPLSSDIPLCKCSRPILWMPSAFLSSCSKSFTTFGVFKTGILPPSTPNLLQLWFTLLCGWQCFSYCSD